MSNGAGDEGVHGGTGSLIVDGRTIPAKTSLETGCAIIGAGAAGITLARTLAGRGIDVCLIESGGLDFDPVVQSLYQGSTSGIAYAPLEQTRLRYLGGSTNHWGGWCRPLDAIDFERRDWIPSSGWPIARATLDPYYLQAQAICELGPFEYDRIAFWSSQSPVAGQAIEFADIRTGVFQFSPPTFFGERYRHDLETLPHLQCVVNATVVGFDTEADGGSVTGLRIATLAGNRFQLQAPVYVLAAGGIENARLLLLPAPGRAAGLGNDLVGRFFMDHPILPDAATVLMRAPDGLLDLFDDRVVVGATTVRACLSPTDRYLRTRRRLHFLATMGPVAHYRADGERMTVRGSEPGPQTGYRLLRLMRGLAAAVPSPPPPDGIVATEYSIGISCEVQPDPANRITLAAEKDALGMPRAHLHWRPGAVDRAGLHAGLMAIGQSITAQRLGRFRLTATNLDDWPGDLIWGCHHSGTTRMSASAASGVVDRDGRVHGLGNLYVTGSSVFPTVGAANPTLTIVALTLRLADRLTERIT